MSLSAFCSAIALSFSWRSVRCFSNRSTSAVFSSILLRNSFIASSKLRLLSSAFAIC